MTKKVRPGRKQPQISKIPRKIEDVSSIEESIFKWRVNKQYIDLDHPEWGWGKLKIEDFFEILTHRLHDYESMTWQDLSQRRSCHSMPVKNIVSKAQARLYEKCPDIDTLYQVDVDRLCRIWGFRDRDFFYLIWHDPNHSVYETKES